MMTYVAEIITLSAKLGTWNHSFSPIISNEPVTVSEDKQLLNQLIKLMQLNTHLTYILPYYIATHILWDKKNKIN